MPLLSVLPSVAALFLLSAFLTLRCHLHSALAPLPALALVVLWLTLFGMAGALRVGIWLLLALCAAAGAAALLPWHGRRPDWLRLASPGAALFWGGTLAFAVWFAIRQPMAASYDELSLWAMAVKATVTDGALYTTAELGVPWSVTQNPGLPLLATFFNLFGGYADWKIYVAYDALYLAVYAAVLGPVPWRRYRLWVPLAAILWCVPWFFTTSNHTIALSTCYMSAYGDIPAGLVMGGAVALWLALRAGGGPRWALLPVLALAANLKANTFVLALVAAGLAAVDAWLFAPEGFRVHFWRRSGFAVACLAAPMAVYALWNVHYVNQLVARDAAAGGMGDTTPALAAVVINGVRALLGAPVTGFYADRLPQFRQAIADMGARFWGSAGTMSMVGQGSHVAALILAVFLCALLAAPGRRARWRVAWQAAGSLACFGGYNLMLALSYGFIFKDFQAIHLTDYDRYIYSYYIGWFLIALACLAAVLRNAPASAPVPARRALAGEAAVLLLAAGMVLRWQQLVLPQHSVLAFSDSEFAQRRAARDAAQRVSAALTPQDRIFYVRQGDAGEHWFAAVFDLYPLAVDYSGDVEYRADYGGGAGGTFGPPERKEEMTGTAYTYYHAYTAEQFDAIVRKNNCTVLYLDVIDELFADTYAPLFTDGLAGARSGGAVLYRVTAEGFAPQPLPTDGTGEVAP